MAAIRLGTSQAPSWDAIMVKPWRSGCTSRARTMLDSSGARCSRTPASTPWGLTAKWSFRSRRSRMLRAGAPSKMAPSRRVRQKSRSRRRCCSSKSRCSRVSPSTRGARSLVRQAAYLGSRRSRRAGARPRVTAARRRPEARRGRCRRGCWREAGSWTSPTRSTRCPTRSLVWTSACRPARSAASVTTASRAWRKWSQFRRQRCRRGLLIG
mmetsp:Transcript_62095/g.178664  ORF Transcript_62095/g.178664 Transcript_62095/m.178664 type:complete len:211 (+) Transcript_62095:298-930(+)